MLTSLKWNELEETEQILFRMSFAYWMVYCVAFGIQKMLRLGNPAVEFKADCYPFLLF